MDDFYVRKFMIYPHSTAGTILQNDYGIVTVKESRLADLLQQFDQKGTRYTGLQELENIFKNDTPKAIDFMRSYGIIENTSRYNFDVDKVTFMANDPSVGDVVDHVFKNSLMNYNYVSDFTTSTVLNCDVQENSFWFVFLNPYSKKLAKVIRDKFLTVDNSYLVISYIYNNCLFIDSVYSAEWKTPCHICQIGWIESDLRSQSGENLSYQQIVDDLFLEDDGFEIGMNLNPNQVLNIATQITNRMQKYLGYNKVHKMKADVLNQGLAMDLRTYLTHTDSPIHWEWCDCYE